MDELGNTYLELAEVFYDTDGVPYAYGNATVSGETEESLVEQLAMFKRSLDMPILNFPEDFTGDVNK
jgi:hypothetical protein